MERSKVFQAIDSERAYQEDKWKEQSKSTIPEYFMYMGHYMRKATESMSTSEDFTSCKDTPKECLRKIAALAVAAAEQHGICPRQGFESALQKYDLIQNKEGKIYSVNMVDASRALLLPAYALEDFPEGVRTSYSQDFIVVKNTEDLFKLYGWKRATQEQLQLPKPA